MSLLEELAGDRQPPTRCRFCVWVSSLSPEEQTEWLRVVEDRSFSIPNLLKAARKRGFPGGESSIRNHRYVSHL